MEKHLLNEGRGGTFRMPVIAQRPGDEEIFFKALNTEEAIEWVSKGTHAYQPQLAAKWLQAKYGNHNPDDVEKYRLKEKRKAEIKTLLTSIAEKIAIPVIAGVLIWCITDLTEWKLLFASMTKFTNNIWQSLTSLVHSIF